MYLGVRDYLGLFIYCLKCSNNIQQGPVFSGSGWYNNKYYLEEQKVKLLNQLLAAAVSLNCAFPFAVHAEEEILDSDEVFEETEPGEEEEPGDPADPGEPTEPGEDEYIASTDVVLSANETTIATEQSQALTATVLPENATDQTIQWSSSDENVAAVDQNGLVTAKTYGTAVITAATADGASAECIVRTRYYDVLNESDYYYNAVYWAADNAITKGFGNVYFGPKKTCTREQMVTFLWKMAGQPETSAGNKFSDVKKGSYYYDAVMWASETGITKGYDNGTFGVGKSCLREHAVTFLWRLAGKPLPQSSSNKFSDIKKSDYYYNAVLWAAENSIAKGYSNGTYGPKKDCLREHIVTFLYRYENTDKSSFYLAEMPKISTAENVSGGVRLTWKKVSGAELYRVYRRTASGSWSKLTDTASLEYTDYAVSRGTVYYYTIRCITYDGTKFKSDFDSGKRIKTICDTPEISSISSSGAKVSLTWGKISGADKYRVFRKTEGGSWAKVADTASISYTDTKAAPGYTYYYTVRCVSSDGSTFESSYDNTGKKIVLMLATPKISSISAGRYSVNLSWGKVTDAVKYRVYRKTGSGSWSRVGDTTGTSFTDNSVSPATTYYYTVRCINSDGSVFTSSYDSNGKSITTEQVIVYVLNKNSKVFHRSTCVSVRNMKEYNKIYSEQTRAEIINMGYSPCHNCNP